MFQSHGPHSPHILYDPLTHDPRDSVHHDPPSPHSPGFETHPVELTTFPEAMSEGATPPRFLPAARYFDGNSDYRDSVASHNTFHSIPSAPNSSVYALQSDAAGAEVVGYRDDPTSSTADPSYSLRYLEEKRSAYSSPRTKSKRSIIMFASTAAAIVVTLAIILPVYFLVIKPKSNNNTAASSASTASGGTSSSTNAIVTGGNGSTITSENGTTFTYINSFGGTWYWDPNDPFNNNAQPNSWTPPLNQSFNFGTDRIFGSVIFDDISSSPPDICLPIQRQPRRLACHRTSKFSVSAARF